MAFTSTVVWECRRTGSDSNGGGFDASSSGTDYSQQDSPQVAYTDLAIGSTDTQFTSAANPPTSAHVGNVVNVTGGTGFAVQRAQITAVSGGIAICDKSLGTAGSTGGTGNLGGALLSPGIAAGLAVAGNTIFLKYSATAWALSNSNNVAGGRVSLPGGSSPLIVAFVGYDTTRTRWNTDANRPVLQPGANNVATVTLGGDNLVRNLGLANPAAYTGCTGITATNVSLVESCTVAGHKDAFFCSWTPATFLNCEASGFTNSGFNGNNQNGITCIACSAHDWSGAALGGFYAVNQAVRCLAYNGTVAGFVGAGGYSFSHCVADAITGASGDGFSLSGMNVTLLNCVATGCGRYGFNSGTGTAGHGHALIHCAGQGNASGDFTADLAAGTQLAGPIAPSASPWAGSGNYLPNAAAGAGALLRGAGYPASLPGGPAGHLDVGAAQHADPAAAASYFAY